MRKFALAIILLFTFLSELRAQNAPLISEKFINTPFSSFIRELEGKLSCQFYYDSKELDSIKINAEFIDKDLEGVLHQVFDPISVHFIFNSDRQIVLSKRQYFQLIYPQGYFLNEPPHKNYVDSYTTSVLPRREDEEGTKVANLENKLYIIGSGVYSQGNMAVLKGFIKNYKTGEPIPGATIYTLNSRYGATSNGQGFFSLTLPKGNNKLFIKAIGSLPTHRLILLKGDGVLNIDLEDQIISLKEVIINSAKLQNLKGTEMGVQRLDIKSIKQVPTTFGETDILQVVLTLPGVKSVGEATTGFNVRGGASDQNLILYNGTTLYNPSHFFGFFSGIDPDMVKDLELYKSSIPAKYGGRLSSVLEINGKEGNKKNISGTAGIGLLTSRLTLEGPIIKNSTSFVIGARTTYSDWILGAIPKSDGYSNSKAGFYDLNLILNSQIDKKDNLNLTGYLSHDRFQLNGDTLFTYSNKNISLRWRHIYTDKLTGTLNGGYDHYDYSNSSSQDSILNYKLQFAINQSHARYDFSFSLNDKNTLEWGIGTIIYKLHPGTYTANSANSLVKPFSLQDEQGIESAAYINDKVELTKSLSLEMGLRFSRYTYLGPHFNYQYPAGIPKQFDQRIDSIQYGSGVNIKTYQSPEYRVSFRYALNDESSIKASYNSNTQNIHLLSNTTVVSPTDIYKLSDPNISPQKGDQLSFGFYKNINSKSLETSVEVYYKRIQNYLDYIPGAQLVLNPHIETDVEPTQGKAYGIEFLIKKTEGRLNGWFSYTYSRTFLRQNNPAIGPVINNGAFYPASYDKPHDFDLVGNYRFTHRFSFSLNMVYSTGRPITIPIGQFIYAGSIRPLYGDRNDYRIPDYFRADIGFNIDGNHKIHQRFHNSWSFGVYNISFRDNPYSTYFSSQTLVINGSRLTSPGVSTPFTLRSSRVNGYQLSIFGTAIPYVNYNIRF